MERLTMRCLDGRACAKGERSGEAQPAVRILPELLERLAQYEDTGLTPEQISDQRWVPISERLPVQEYENTEKSMAAILNLPEDFYCQAHGRRKQ